MSYKSPVWMDIVGDVTEKIETEQGLKIMAAVRQVVKVDEEELKKALKYDRWQYEKGYREGRNDVISEIEELIERLNA